MNELMTKSLAQIVNNDYRAAAIFEKYHLDFCCKGKRSLHEACVENELIVDEVIADLEKASSDSCSIAVDCNHYTLTQLVDYIVATHHSYVKKEMEPILGYLQKVAVKHGGRHPEMIKVMELFTVIKGEMEEHMRKEELMLFPRIKEIEQSLKEGEEIVPDSNYLLASITMMEDEHDHAGGILAEIRKLTNDYNPPVDACTTYRLSFAALAAFELDLHRHVHLENNILFPKTLKMFGQPIQSFVN